MPKIDLWWPGAARIELDQRSRETRLRLDHLEQLLVLRILPAQSWFRETLYHHVLRVFGFGERPHIRSLDATLTGPQPRQMYEMPAEIGVVPPLQSAAVSSAAGISRDRRAA